MMASCWVLLLVAGTSVWAQVGPPTAKPPAALEKIAYYQKQIEKHPKHYPAYARLGRAWLDQARKTYDPAALAEARSALRRSLEIQPNYEALHDSAAAANYSHRFEEALKWCRQAAEAFPEDKGIVAMQVEALLALGRSDEARSAIGGKDAPIGDFYSAAALGHWHVSKGQREEAVAQFLAAARFAKQQKADSLALWATVTAAGVWLDSGNLPLSKPLLNEAAKLDPDEPFLKTHWAELAAAESRPAEALRIYDELLIRQVDPELHRRAYVLARELGQQKTADEHLAAAEKLCRRALDADEVFSLETLANLCCDAGRFGDAVRFAEQNIKFKNDAAAKETLARARQSAAK